MSFAASTLRRSRRLAAVSVIAVAAFSLTACGGGEEKAGGDQPSSSVPAPAGDQPKPADGGQAGGSSTDGTSAGKGSQGATTGGKQGSATGGGAATGGGTGGTGGAATGGGTGGAGTAPGGKGESAGKGSNKGVNGTWVGTLKYLAPGKLTVAPKSGAEQAFWVAADTKILGAAAICGGKDGQVTADGSGYGTTRCTDADLDKAAKLGSVQVRVTLQNGIAGTVAEHYHP